MRNIQPWCISRQLWWGHQIPAWYGFRFKSKDRLLIACSDWFDNTEEVFVSEEGIDAVVKQAQEYCRKNSDAPISVEVVESRVEAQRRLSRTEDETRYFIWRDEDVLDTW